MLNSLYEGVCHLNPQGEILHYNHAAQTHWHINNLHSDLLLSQLSVSRALAGQYVKHKLVRLDNHKALLVNTLPLYTKNSLIGIMVVSQDITEPLLLERQALQALEILTEATYTTQYLTDGDEVLKRIAALITELESVDNSIAFR